MVLLPVLAGRLRFRLRRAPVIRELPVGSIPLVARTQTVARGISGSRPRSQPGVCHNKRGLPEVLLKSRRNGAERPVYRARWQSERSSAGSGIENRFGLVFVPNGAWRIREMHFPITVSRLMALMCFSALFNRATSGLDYSRDPCKVDRPLRRAMLKQCGSAA
jgi:hypothetical protein